jgi:hypothetical protein
MAKSSTFDNDFLKLIFNATPIANLADNAASSPLTNLYISLHTADPTAAGTQSSNEATYTGYARVSTARTTGAWTVTGASVSPVSNITFPPCTAGSSSVTYMGVGVASTGATKLLWSGPVSPTIAVTAGVTPLISTATTIGEA